MSHTIHLEPSKYVVKTAIAFITGSKRISFSLYSSALFEEEKIVLKPSLYFHTQQ